MSLPALKELFSRHRGRATGQWRLGQEPHRMVFLEAGDIVFATSTHPLDRLTHLLVERGKITQAQLDYAMANLNPGMSIGKNLIEMGFITQRDLLDVARAQVERVVWAVIAATDGQPTFEAKELDATTVRLPFDTPAMLLSGVLNLRDRELVLEELGPLNQVAVMEGRRFQELLLPPDLAKLPGLLDGSRTLLELSREAGIEPFRLGAFVLFLREMGWARLHQLPPLDRRALELALDPADPVLSPTLPEPEPTPVRSLFAEIHASQHPTTNLEHLSEALDQLGPEDELEDPFPDEPPPAVPTEPALPIHHQAEGSTEPLREPPPALLSPTPAPRRSWLLVAALVVAVAAAGMTWYRRSHTRLIVPAQSITPPPPAATLTPPPTQVPEGTEAPTTPAPEPAVSKSLPPAQEPPASVPPVDSKPPVTTAVPSRSERLEAIVQGRWPQAVTQGALQRKALHGRWTLRLEIACQGSTVQHAVELLKGRDPDLFLVPMAMRDGRTCYQVFLGSFGSKAAAKDAARKLPPPSTPKATGPSPSASLKSPISNKCKIGHDWLYYYFKAQIFTNGLAASILYTYTRWLIHYGHLIFVELDAFPLPSNQLESGLCVMDP